MANHLQTTCDNLRSFVAAGGAGRGWSHAPPALVGCIRGSGGAATPALLFGHLGSLLAESCPRLLGQLGDRLLPFGSPGGLFYVLSRRGFLSLRSHGPAPIRDIG